ncbi:MAG: tetratricopeptide repeat protein [Rubrobacter sp.]|nr:tetratricopeptide repeat protein [Rubrobacter sp.]
MTREELRAQHRAVRSGLKGRLFTPEALVLLLSLASLTLILPLRTSPIAAPPLLFLATLMLFVVPGLLLSRLTLGGSLAGAARLSVAFVLSIGLFSLMAVPALVLRWNLGAYLWVCGVILALSLCLIAYEAVRGRRPEKNTPGLEIGRIDWLWIPFTGLMGVLAYATVVKVQLPLSDSWIYLAQVREYLITEELGRYSPFSGGEIQFFSRMTVDGWLLLQAAFSRISNIEPVALVLEFLAPTLAVIALLALYALAKVLFRNETAALLSGSLAALLLLVGLGTTLLSPEEFVGRITEDKFVVRFVFLPVVLIVAVLYLRQRRLRFLGLFAFLCLSMAAVHPIGLIFTAISVGSFGIVHLAVNPKEMRAWQAVGGLAAVLVGIVAPPTIYLLATGSPILSRLESESSDTATALITSWQYEQRLLDLGEGYYIAHPSLLLNPVVVAIYLVGIPFLIWNLKKSLAAQLLLGILVLTPVPIYLPYTATLLGRIIGPWVLVRFTWPLTLAATLTLGWVCYQALTFLAARLQRSRSAVPQWIAPLLPLVLVCALVVGGAAPAAAVLRSTDSAEKIPQQENSCQDPVFHWMGEEITTSSKVLALQEESSCIPAYAAPVNIVGFREVLPETRPDVQYFYKASVLDFEMLQILARQQVDYVLLRTGSPLNEQLEHMPVFTALNNPGERYRLYAVDRYKLYTLDRARPSVMAALGGNSELNQNDPDQAIEAYSSVLANPQSTDDDQLLAYLGLGQVYAKGKQFAEAAYNYEQAAALEPKDPGLQALVSQVHDAAESPDAARAAMERAVELDPQDMELRSKLAALLLKTEDRQGAVAQLQQIVESYPNVPTYHVNLGRALLVGGDQKDADEELTQAVYLDPLSAEIHANVGDAYLMAGNPNKASESYERAMELKPENQFYPLRLGMIYSALSTQNGWYEEYFERAEETLRHAERLKPAPGGKDYSDAIQLALGDLYSRWERKEEAKNAYEKALELNPESKEAKQRLEKL